MDSLRTIWQTLTSNFTENATLIDELWAEIETAYSTRKRHYHNLEHLKYMVDKAFTYRAKLKDLDTVLFTIFYHDIVYNTKRQDNEQKSADIARDRLAKLGVPAEKILACQNQIIATKDHNDDSDNDTNYLVDFDLAILGDTSDNYKSYSKKIRSEYSLYPDFLYKKGRKRVLRHFLDMERIFKTVELYESYELPARENLRAELKDLS